MAVGRRRSRAELITAGVTGLSALTGNGDALFWLESRPDEGGRNTLIMWRDGTAQRTHADAVQRAHARARVWRRRVSRDEQRRLLRQFRRSEHLSGAAHAAAFHSRSRTPTQKRAMQISLSTNRARASSRSVSDPERRNAKTACVAVDIATGATTDLHRGHDFYAAPRISPDGRRLCFLSWDHPNMPWDGTQLHVASAPRRRHAHRRDHRRRRRGRVHRAARVADVGSHPVCVGPERLLEPLQLRRRAASTACIPTKRNTAGPRGVSARNTTACSGPVTSSPSECTKARRAC